MVTGFSLVPEVVWAKTALPVTPAASAVVVPRFWTVAPGPKLSKRGAVKPESVRPAPSKVPVNEPGTYVLAPLLGAPRGIEAPS